MEAAVVKRKPRIRAAVRNGLNRFCLVNEMETDKRKGAAQLVRLALISRAHLESVRRSARGIKFKEDDHKWRLRLECGLGTPKIIFPVDLTEMIGIISLLEVPVHLKFSTDVVDWKELQRIEQHVNGLTVYDYFGSPEFAAFIGSVSSHLNVLQSTWSVLARLPALSLERARLWHPPSDFNELNRHKIRRLELPLSVLYDRLDLQSNQRISSSIRSLCIMHVHCWAPFPYDTIEAFCRRFSGLEDLHISCKYNGWLLVPGAYFTELWAKCLEMRDRLHVAGLKRLFLTIKHDCTFSGTKTDWFEKLKLVEPFDKATSTIDRSNKCVRMFLKHNEPRGPKPTFILIKGRFEWALQGGEDLSDDQMEDETEDEAMEEDEELDGSSKDAMDKNESTDEDGMDDAGVL
ncbi:hypothetical protein M3Y99_00708200 [Aphelenchoides fujianensis]|nr:hypothetical protein M3Y99_00708200 [Aphelenchoides fujianensis]